MPLQQRPHVGKGARNEDEAREIVPRQGPAGRRWLPVLIMAVLAAIDQNVGLQSFAQTPADLDRPRVYSRVGPRGLVDRFRSRCLSQCPERISETGKR